MENLINNILGGYSAWQFISFVFFFLIGLAIYSVQETRERDIESKFTPKKFNFKFFILDNLRRFALAILLIYVQFRFFKELTGQELTEFTALLIGYAGNGISGFGKRNIKALQANRDKLLNKQQP